MLVVLKKKKEKKKPVKVHLLIQNGSSPKSCHVMYKSHSKLYSVPLPLPMTLAETSKWRQSQMMDGYRCSLTPPPQITWDYLLGTPSFQSPYPFYVTDNHFSMAPESPFWPLKSFFPADTSRKPLRCQVPYRCAWRPLELQGGMAPTCIYLQGVGRTWSKDWALVCELIFFK